MAVPRTLRRAFATGWGTLWEAGLRGPYEQPVNRFHRRAEPVFVRAAELDERAPLRRHLLHEGLVHPLADRLAVARAVLNERRVEVGEEVEVGATVAGSDRLHGGGASPHVAAV